MSEARLYLLTRLGECSRKSLTSYYFIADTSNRLIDGPGLLSGYALELSRVVKPSKEAIFSLSKKSKALFKPGKIVYNKPKDPNWSWADCGAYRVIDARTVSADQYAKALKRYSEYYDERDIAVKEMINATESAKQIIDSKKNPSKKIPLLPDIVMHILAGE